MKSDGSAFKTINRKTQCDPEKLKAYFAKHFTDTGDGGTDPDEFITIPDFIAELQDISSNVAISSLPPNETELRSTIRKMKSGKSSIDVPVTYLKSALESNTFIHEMVQLYQTVWDTNHMPKNWGHSKLVALWKGTSKGKADDPKAYRALQIGSSMCKIMVIIIIQRIKKWYEAQMQDQQQGFRTGRGTTDGLYYLKRLHQVTAGMKKKAYILFVDLTAAFDHVKRPWLFRTIEQRLPDEPSRKLFRILESLYSFTTTALAETPDDLFELFIGVRQGGPESPLLYNLYMDYVMRVFLDDCKKHGIKFLNLKYRIPQEASRSNRMNVGCTQIDWIGYADDLVLAFESTDDLEKAINLLNCAFKRFKLEINMSKTKSMILNYDEPLEYPTSIAKIDGSIIENVQVFQYLGCKIKFDEPSTGNAEIELRIDAGESKFYELGKNLMNYKIKLHTRVRMLNSLVRSRLTYACQSWSITRIQLNRLSSTYCAMLRKMIKGGYRRKQNTWSFEITNQDLLRIGNTEDISDFIARQQRNYAAHVIRKEITSALKRRMFNDDDQHNLVVT